MLALGTITSPVFHAVGGTIIAAGLYLWIAQFAARPRPSIRAARFLERRPVLASSRYSTVEHMRAGMPGYRFRLPIEVHPISAGVRGGIIGGLVMPIPGSGLWALERPRYLVSGKSPGRNGLARRWIDDERRARAISPAAPAARNLHSRHHVGGSGFDLWRAVADVAANSQATRLGRPADAVTLDGRELYRDGSCQSRAGKGVDWPWFIASQFLFGVVAAALLSADYVKLIRY